jgi:hypothetical protein
MASERQIAANRRNSLKSTGPRSAGGKKRASRNAHQHGLAAPMVLDTQLAQEVDRLARQIAGNAVSAIAHARTVAEAALELGRVRQVKVGLIECVATSGDLDRRPELTPLERAARGLPPGRIRAPKPIEPSVPLPPHPPDRSAEALRRALPALTRLDRYERRAATRFDRAVRALYNLD